MRSLPSEPSQPEAAADPVPSHPVDPQEPQHVVLHMPVDVRSLALVVLTVIAILAVLRWAQAFSCQVAFTALSQAVDHVDERLARWILMCHDRVDGDRLALTHEFLAVMPAVRRASVTNALHVVEGEGAIKASRSLIAVRSRAKLEALAGACYGLPESEYRRVLSHDAPSSNVSEPRQFAEG